MTSSRSWPRYVGDNERVGVPLSLSERELLLPFTVLGLRVPLVPLRPTPWACDVEPWEKPLPAAIPLECRLSPSSASIVFLRRRFAVLGGSEESVVPAGSKEELGSSPATRPASPPACSPCSSPCSSTGPPSSSSGLRCLRPNTWLGCSPSLIVLVSPVGLGPGRPVARGWEGARDVEEDDSADCKAGLFAMIVPGDGQSGLEASPGRSWD